MRMENLTNSSHYRRMTSRPSPTTSSAPMPLAFSRNTRSARAAAVWECVTIRQAAPRARASPRKSWPSRRSVRMATKASPARNARVSVPKPVTAAGVGERCVYLPKGIWLDAWTRERVEGGGHVCCSAPVHRIPVFIRDGAAVTAACCCSAICSSTPTRRGRKTAGRITPVRAHAPATARPSGRRECDRSCSSRYHFNGSGPAGAASNG